MFTEKVVFDGECLDRPKIRGRGRGMGDIMRVKRVTGPGRLLRVGYDDILPLGETSR